MSHPVIECHSLQKSYGNTPVINDFNLQVDKTSTVGLVGPNGAGKTTLLSLFCGFIRPTGGQVRIMGLDPQSARLKGKIGILPQNVPLQKGIPVNQQLLLFARLQGFRKKTAVEEVNRIIEMTQITALYKRIPETLSFGQQKKVFLAQALLGNPEIILLDEPTSGLDPVAADEVRTIIYQTRGSNTCLVSSHNLDEIKTICDDIIVIDRGKLVKHCTINELTGSSTCITILFEHEPDEKLLQALTTIRGVTEINLESPGNKRVSVHFDSETPGMIQNNLLKHAEEQGASIVEFNRGSTISKRVRELIGGQD